MLQRHIQRMNADASDEPWKDPKISKFTTTFRWQNKRVIIETNLSAAPGRTSVRIVK